MANSLMNTGVSGLKAAQNKLSVINNNVNNAYTPGYNRQNLTLRQADATKHDAGFIGNGVAYSPINRLYNGFLVGQLRDAESKTGSADVYHERLTKIDNYLGDSATGLSTQIDSVFTNLNVLSADVSRQSARQAVVSNIQSLTNRFNESGDILKKHMDGVNESIGASVDQVNSYTSKIAELNERINKLRGADRSGEPNFLLDERDNLVNELNKIVGVTLLEQGDQYNLSTANGLNLVQNDTSFALSVRPSNGDASMKSIVYTYQSGQETELNSKYITSGELNGLLKFREGPLTDARNQLGLIALNLAERFNEVHQGGVDVNGRDGKQMFTFDEPEVLTNNKNTGSASISVNFESISDVKASDYEVRYVDNNWEVTRISDKARITPEESGGSLHFDGLSVNITGSADNKDSFIIKPVTHVASSLNMLIQDPDDIATGIKDSEYGSGDNRNILKLLDIQNEKLVNGTATLSRSYGKLVSFIGNETHFAEVSSDAFKKIVDQITEQNQSYSGVNLDEEYVNMQVYMQYYQANAKLIDTATTVFDTLLGLRG